MPPKPWENWYHVTGSTYGAWLRGDPRGWRARDHREHVIGDYRHPPPPGTYDKLHNYSKFIMTRDAVILTWSQRLAAAAKMAEALRFHNVEFIDLCVSATHFHILCRFEPPGPGIAIPGLSPLNPRASKIRTPRHLIGIAKKNPPAPFPRRASPPPVASGLSAAVPNPFAALTITTASPATFPPTKNRAPRSTPST